MKKYYTGVGARKTPDDVLELMASYSRVLEFLGYILRSGGQPKGADGAFEAAVACSANKVIYKPKNWQRNPGDPVILNEAYDIAAQHHPVWVKLLSFVRDLMARNVHAVLGDRLDDPSEFLICWTEDGMNNVKPRTPKAGGTGHTLAIAKEHNVKIYNLKNEEDERALDLFIVSLMDNFYYETT